MSEDEASAGSQLKLVAKKTVAPKDDPRYESDDDGPPSHPLPLSQGLVTLVASNTCEPTMVLDNGADNFDSEDDLEEKVADIKVIFTSASPKALVDEYVTECSALWCIVGFVLTTCHTGIYAAFALSGNPIYHKFYAWVSKPTCVTAMAISFLLKPRRTDLKYQVFLLFQYCLLTFGSELLIMIGFEFERGESIQGILTIFFFFFVLIVSWRIRSRVAKLSDADLSEFLSMSVVKVGLVVGLGQLAFLAFSSIQCESEAKLEYRDWSDCNRSLYSQAGLGGLVSLFTIITLVSGVAPKRYIEKHTIKTRDIVTMNLKIAELIQVLGLAIAGGCGLFLLGNYGVKGDFSSEFLEDFFNFVMILGGASLFITAAWKGLVIRAEMQHDQDAAGRGQDEGQVREAGASPGEEDQPPVTKLSVLFVFISFLATSFQTALNVACSMTGRRVYETATNALLPLIVIVYVGGLFAQPRRRDRPTMYLLRAHFISFAWISEMSYVCYELARRQCASALTHLGRGLLETLIFHYGLKLRSSIGRLPDEDLNDFLIDALFKSGLATITSCLFVLFRATKCMVEQGERGRGLRHCDKCAASGVFFLTPSFATQATRHAARTRTVPALLAYTWF